MDRRPAGEFTQFEFFVAVFLDQGVEPPGDFFPGADDHGLHARCWPSARRSSIFPA